MTRWATLIAARNRDVRLRTAVRQGGVCLLAIAVSFLAAPVCGGLAYYQKDFAEMGQVPNTYQGICAAAANVNSLVYLSNHYPGVYGDTSLLYDWNGDGSITNSDNITTRDKMAWGWTSPGGTSRPGIYGSGNTGTAEQIWEATYWWFNDFAPGTSLLGGRNERGSYGWDGGSLVAQGLPTWNDLWDALVNARDMELGLLEVNGSLAHAVTLAGMAFDDLDGNGLWDTGETPVKIGYLDPNSLSAFRWADATFNAYFGLEFTWWQTSTTFRVYRAFFEGSALVPGDATGDGIVNELDASRLTANWGFSNATWSMGDFDGDDIVGAGDASILAANWGYGAASGEEATMPMVGPVPEPSTWTLFVGIVLVGLAARRR
jgi:hypothetical protein